MCYTVFSLKASCCKNLSLTLEVLILFFWPDCWTCESEGSWGCEEEECNREEEEEMSEEQDFLCDLARDTGNRTLNPGGIIGILGGFSFWKIIYVVLKID
jgi:hypothetical protein